MLGMPRSRLERAGELWHAESRLPHHILVCMAMTTVERKRCGRWIVAGLVWSFAPQLIRQETPCSPEHPRCFPCASLLRPVILGVGWQLVRLAILRRANIVDRPNLAGEGRYRFDVFVGRCWCGRRCWCYCSGSLLLLPALSVVMLPRSMVELLVPRIDSTRDMNQVQPP